jgi:hypothetical protein
MSSSRRGRGHLPGLSLLLAALLLAGCRSVSSGEETAAPPQVTLYGVRLSNFRGTQLAMSGRAAKVTYYRAPAEFSATETLVRFPGRPGMSAAVAGLEVRAPSVSGDLVHKQAVWRDGVVMGAPAGISAYTPRATFDGQTMQASGKDRVTVDGPGYALSANGFHLYFPEERFEFGDGVVSRLGGR